MTEFEKHLLDKIDRIRTEFKEDIVRLHNKMDEADKNTNKKMDAVKDNLLLFKGKVFGVWAVLTVIINVGMQYFKSKP